MLDVSNEENEVRGEILQKCSALFIWGTIIYLMIGLL